MKTPKNTIPCDPAPGALRQEPSRVLEYVEEDTGEWGRVRHWRTVDTLGLMLKAGTIDDAMHDAGRQFQQTFLQAFRSGYASPRYDALPRGTLPTQTDPERHAGAARAVHAALAAAGGMGSLTADALWWVVGVGISVRQWAARQRLVRSPERARGVLIAALAMLARFYGYRHGGGKATLGDA